MDAWPGEETLRRDDSVIRHQRANHAEGWSWLPARTVVVRVLAALSIISLLPLDSGSGQEDTLVLVGSYPGLYHARGVFGFNQHAWVADWSHGLRVVDYSNPSSPESIAVHPGYAYDVEIADNFAYCGGLGFYIKDASCPQDTHVVGSCCYIGNQNFKVHVFDTLVLVMRGSFFHEVFLEIIDVSDPSSPLLLSDTRADPPYGTMWHGDAWKKDQYVYWVDRVIVEYEDVGRVIVFDISDPTDPVQVLIDTCLHAGGNAIWIAGDHAYVAEEYGGVGLMVLDVSDPYNIDSVGCFPIPEGMPWNLYIKDNYAYICAHLRPTLPWDRIYVLDISDPSTPTMVTYYNTLGGPRDIFVDEPYVLVAQDTSLLILQASFLEPLPGDANKDGAVDIGDVIFVLNYLFKEGFPPFPLELGDVNGDGTVDIGDVVYLLNYLFKGGPAPHGGRPR